MTRFITAYMACGESTARRSLSARPGPARPRAPPRHPGRTHGGSQDDAEVEAQRLPVLLEDLLLALGARLPLGLQSQERRSASPQSPGPRKNPAPHSPPWPRRLPAPLPADVTRRKRRDRARGRRDKARGQTEPGAGRSPGRDRARGGREGTALPRGPPTELQNSEVGKGQLVQPPCSTRVLPEVVFEYLQRGRRHTLSGQADWEELHCASNNTKEQKGCAACDWDHPQCSPAFLGWKWPKL